MLSVALIKHLAKGDLQEWSSFCLTVQRVESLQGQDRGAALNSRLGSESGCGGGNGRRGPGSREGLDHSLNSSLQAERGSRAKLCILKATSSDMLPPGRLHLLTLPNGATS